MTLRATDDDGATIETPFTVIVDNSGRINQRPSIKKQPKDAIGLYKQPFILPISDSIFVDNDGFISKIEIVGLPKWAQFRKGEIRGLADVVATYNITLRAYDDEDATVETTFKIVVNYPTVHFDLISAGKAGQRFLLKRLQKDEKLLANNLPTALNLYAGCDAIFDAFDLELTGPHYQKTFTNRSPFSLFVGDAGFPTVAGTYQLKGTAYFRKELIASTLYSFQIIPTDPVTKQPITITDWTLYPNPFDGFLNIKTPTKTTINVLEISTLFGQRKPISQEFIFSNNDLISINLQPFSLASGLYFLRIQNEDGSWRVFKVIKH